MASNLLRVQHRRCEFDALVEPSRYAATLRESLAQADNYLEPFHVGRPRKGNDHAKTRNSKI